MFKKIITIGVLLSPLFTFASGGETKSFNFQGQHALALDLRGELTHTEYRDETVAETCWRDVLDRYETRCYNEPIRVCYPFIDTQAVAMSHDDDVRGHEPRPPGGGNDGRGPGLVPGPRPPGRPDPYPGPGPNPRPPPPPPQCRTEYRQRCEQYPVYRSEPYTCYRTRRISFEVKDADVINHVNFEFGAVPVSLIGTELFTVSSNGRDLNISAQSANQILYSLNKQQSEINQGSLVEVQTRVAVTMQSAAILNAPVVAGMSGLSANSDVISFVVGKVSRPETIVPHLVLKKKRFLIGSKTLVDKDLQVGEYTLTDLGSQTRIDIKTASLGQDLAGDKIKIKASLRLNVQGTFANPQVLSNAQPEQEIEVKF